jgi:regulator of sigma E protease
MLAQPPIWFIIIAFLCVIGPLVLIHELGHYWVARWFGIGAETFSIGFGRKIAGWTDKRGTLWKIGWLPLGGYVRFVGDENVASAAGDQSVLSEDQKRRSFHLRPVYQRFLVVLAGPVANFLLAILIFAAFFAVLGKPTAAPVIGAVEPASAAAGAGLQPGDRITSIAGRDVDDFRDIQRLVQMRPAERLEIRFQRNGEPATITVEPRVRFEKDNFGNQFKIGFLGVGPSGDLELKRISLLQSFPEAGDYCLKLTQSMVDGIWQIISGRRSVKDLGGPLKIAQVAGQQASLGALQFIQLAALISINLGFINLLPVPMLDGGHLLFYSIEGVRRRPVSPETQDWAFRGGLALLLALLLFTTFNDLASFGLWDRLGRLIG